MLANPRSFIADVVPAVSIGPYFTKKADNVFRRSDGANAQAKLEQHCPLKTIFPKCMTFQKRLRTNNTVNQGGETRDQRHHSMIFHVVALLISFTRINGKLTSVYRFAEV